MENALTAFIAVERNDADDMAVISERTSNSIAELAQRVGLHKIMLIHMCI